MQIIIDDNQFQVYGFGAQSQFEYGTLNEILIKNEASDLKGNTFKISKLLLVDNKKFRVDTSDELVVYDENDKKIVVSISDIPDNANDTERMSHFLKALGFNLSQSSNLEMYLLSFGVNGPENYCNDCWTNKGCKLNGCGKTCDWPSFKCEH